ncbi:MAG: hypothetical protein KC620_03890, partial [Myxococcales bacterium]|nr:hypothetical protein [Myxococcales bacterium]
MNGIHRLLLIGVCLGLPAAALALPEGTPQLGLNQGLLGNATIQVFAHPGETIRVCSSDEGFTDPDVQEDLNGNGQIDAGETFRLDRGVNGQFERVPHCGRAGGDCTGGRAVMPAGRQDAEIVVYRPNPANCANDNDCGAGYTCRNKGNGEPYAGAGRSACGLALPVNAVIGYCNAQQPPADRPWHEVAVDVEGKWQVNFVGEPETLTTTGRSTRYFEVDVLDAGGDSVNGGRVSDDNWTINAHSFSYGTYTNFYVVATVNQGARIFVIDFENMRGFNYSLLANRTGVNGHPSVSWCFVGDPDPILGLCPTDLAGQGQFSIPEYDIYLTFPDPAPAGAPRPVIQNVQFNDEVGSASISPNGDGQQDRGAFTFTSNVAGTYEVVLDTDGDGTFNTALDLVLRGEAVVGQNSVEWDGRDRAGRVVADGEYLFEIRLITAETHFPMSDIEENVDGFIVYELAAPGAAQGPLRMFWDDREVALDRPLIDANDRLTSLPDGSVVPVGGQGNWERRRWRQNQRVPVPGQQAVDVPMVFDTWVIGDRVTTNEGSCLTCDAPINSVNVGGPDDPGLDRDGDGLPDNLEDLDGDGVVDPGETDPNDPDTDGDGILDGVEDANRNGQRDPGETDPTRADTDGDGLGDGEEDADHDGQLDDGETDPRTRDTDGDGRDDDKELRGEVRSDPRNPDTDGDGLLDGEEDADNDGRRDPLESDPSLADTDGDGLNDGIEVNGDNPTSPVEADTDGDGLPDGVEDADRNGRFDEGETNPNDEDTDDDLIPDGTEDGNHDGVHDPDETDPLNPDSDADGIRDGDEDRNRNGVFEADRGELDPLNPDTDGDGLLDGVEDVDQDGSFDDGETDPRNRDTDGDGLEDGEEDANLNGIWGPVDGETDPRNPDTDGGGEWDGSEVEGGRNPVDNPGDDLADTDMDGLRDVEEDRNGNGIVDPGETDPNNPDTDGDGLLDGQEDRNRDGTVDENETDPLSPDTDQDGILDGAEDRDHDGVVDGDESDPRVADTDGDGIRDGNEDRNRDGIRDPDETHPNNPDTDGDGIGDGIEDANRDGIRQAGELDPLNP